MMLYVKVTAVVQVSSLVMGFVTQVKIGDWGLTSRLIDSEWTGKGEQGNERYLYAQV